MKPHFLISIALWLVVSLSIQPVVAQSTSSQTVYVTKTGEKYHKSTCRYLSQSKIETTLTDAKEDGFTACSVCKPSGSTGKAQKAAPKSSSSVRCSGTTQAGNRCKRMTKNANGRCYQH